MHLLWLALTSARPAQESTWRRRPNSQRRCGHTSRNWLSSWRGRPLQLSPCLHREWPAGQCKTRTDAMAWTRDSQTGMPQIVEEEGRGGEYMDCCHTALGRKSLSIAAAMEIRILTLLQDISRTSPTRRRVLELCGTKKMNSPELSRPSLYLPLQPWSLHLHLKRRLIPQCTNG